MFGTRRSSRLFCIKEPAYSRHRPGTRPVRRAPRAVEQRLAHPGPRKTNNIAWGTSHGRRRLPSFAGRVVPGDRAADERSRGSSRAAPQSRPISRPSHENGGLDWTRCTDRIGERGWAATISAPNTTAAWSHDEGEELPSLHAAKTHAAKVAAELYRNNSVRVRVFVLSEEGAVLATEPSADLT
jgi:hypothetical protein